MLTIKVSRLLCWDIKAKKLVVWAQTKIRKTTISYTDIRMMLVTSAAALPMA